MTDKSPKTKAELEAFVLVELRAASQCGGAVHVTVVPFDDYRVRGRLGGGQLQCGHICAGSV